jgi:hypothetical protein
MSVPATDAELDGEPTELPPFGFFLPELEPPFFLRPPPPPAFRLPPRLLALLRFVLEPARQSQCATPRASQRPRHTISVAMQS